MTPAGETAADQRVRLGEGEEIAPGRTALRALGGGHRYDAYLAWDEALHTVVVCKVLRPHLRDDARALAGLAGEWEMLERLRHPVIVRGLDATLDGPRPHLVLEHLEGPRLSTLVRRYGPLPVEQLVPLALELCSALHYLRERDVVHLDIKPSNTIMGAPPRMIDLSVALSTDEAAALERPVGTDAYMAPEQCDPRGGFTVGPQADVWGLGATLLWAATGEPPFGEPDRDAPDGPRRWPQLAARPDRPQRLPDDLAELILGCLAHDPAQRPAPDGIYRALEPVLDGLPKPRLSRLKPRL